jgi:hypothetical protein
MVALAVYRLGYTPKPCLAKPMLFASLACYDAGDYIGSGVRLRESVKRFVVAACDWYGVPVKGKHPSPAEHVRSLRDAQQIDKWSCQALLDIIDVGNKAAHCQGFDARQLRSGISLLFAVMDSEPYCGHERRPAATSYLKDGECNEGEYDDDDGAGWWKGGAV